MLLYFNASLLWLKTNCSLTSIYNQIFQNILHTSWLIAWVVILSIVFGDIENFDKLSIVLGDTDNFDRSFNNRATSPRVTSDVKQPARDGLSVALSPVTWKRKNNENLQEKLYLRERYYCTKNEVFN